MNMTWNEAVIGLLYAVITAAIPVITAYVIKYLKSLQSKVNVEAEDFVISSTLDSVFEVITSVVATTSQTYVDALKEAGTFDEAAQKRAFEITKNTIMSMLSEEAKLLLVSLYNDLDAWLTAQIEASVRANKNSKKEGV